MPSPEKHSSASHLGAVTASPEGQRQCDSTCSYGGGYAPLTCSLPAGHALPHETSNRRNSWPQTPVAASPSALTGCTPCSDCGTDYAALTGAWLVSDEFWERVVGSDGSIVLCPRCFIARADAASLSEQGVEGDEKKRNHDKLPEEAICLWRPDDQHPWRVWDGEVDGAMRYFAPHARPRTRVTGAMIMAAAKAIHFAEHPNYPWKSAVHDKRQLAEIALRAALDAVVEEKREATDAT